MLNAQQVYNKQFHRFHLLQGKIQLKPYLQNF